MPITHLMSQVELTSLQHRYVTRRLAALNISRPTEPVVEALASNCASHVSEAFADYISFSCEEDSPLKDLDFEYMDYPDVEANYIKEFPKPYAFLNEIVSAQ